jgi:hypothetical protein
VTCFVLYAVSRSTSLSSINTAGTGSVSGCDYRVGGEGVSRSTSLSINTDLWVGGKIVRVGEVAMGWEGGYWGWGRVGGY